MSRRPVVRRVVIDESTDIMNPMPQGFNPLELRNEIARTAALNCAPDEKGDVRLRSASARVMLSLDLSARSSDLRNGGINLDDNCLMSEFRLPDGATSGDFDWVFNNAIEHYLSVIRKNLTAYIVETE